ncbi:MAG TPA: acyl-CoA dehydrogenase family protein, partial [Kofleriaceae bacterium]
MTWKLDAAQQEILDAADKFARRELAPLASRMDADEWWPPEAMPKIAAAGFLGITIPAALGGSDNDLFASGLVLQAFARHNHALALSWVAHENLCLNNIYRHATPEQQQKFIPGMCAGTAIGGLGLTEPGAGSDALGSMRTTARRDGEFYVLNGQKLYITNGPVADLLLVYAKTDPERGTKGISAFIVEKSQFRVAQKLTKMGFRGSQTAEIVFEDSRVPVANRLGEENRGVAITMSGLDLERAMISPLCLGISERALELAITYAKQREQFGKPIASFQMVQAKLAEMYVRVETMRAFTYRVLAQCNELEASAG